MVARMSTLTNQEKETEEYPSSNSTAISIQTSANLQSRRSKTVEETTQEQEQQQQIQQTTRNSHGIPPFDYSLLEPAPKTGFDWVKLIIRQYRALGTRYKTELIAGRTLSILVNWLPFSIYSNIRSFIEFHYPPIQMPPPQSKMNDDENKVSKTKNKQKMRSAGNGQMIPWLFSLRVYVKEIQGPKNWSLSQPFFILLLAEWMIQFNQKQIVKPFPSISPYHASVPLALEGTFPRALFHAFLRDIFIRR